MYPDNLFVFGKVIADLILVSNRHIFLQTQLKLFTICVGQFNCTHKRVCMADICSDFDNPFKVFKMERLRLLKLDPVISKYLIFKVFIFGDDTAKSISILEPRKVKRYQLCLLRHFAKFFD